MDSNTGVSPVIFTAQNVDDIEGLKQRYPSDLPNKYYHHSTNRFGRQPFDEREGEKMRLHITGRLRNGVVDALVVDNPNSDNEIPHITLATAEGVKPFASNRELAMNKDKIEPLDDYVETTFRNNLANRKVGTEGVSRLRSIIQEAVNSVIAEKVGGHNYANGGDEFYTRYSDVSRELSNYNFDGKVVYCCCDDPKFSNFYRYFKDNFEALGLKGLYVTWYSDSPYVVYYDGVSEKRTPVKSGRFQDNAEIMKQCDIVVTNPPFSGSMPHHLVGMAKKMGKHVIIVGPLHMARRNDMFDMVKNGELNYGYTPINRYSRGSETKGSAPTAWWTTMDVKREPYMSGKHYVREAYPKYDNFDAIECRNYAEIPDDYEGNIGVPWRFLGKLDRNQFDIVGKIRPVLDGKKLDTRLIIRRKNNTFAEAVFRRFTQLVLENNLKTRN